MPQLVEVVSPPAPQEVPEVNQPSASSANSGFMLSLNDQSANNSTYDFASGEPNSDDEESYSEDESDLDDEFLIDKPNSASFENRNTRCDRQAEFCIDMSNWFFCTRCSQNMLVGNDVDSTSWWVCAGKSELQVWCWCRGETAGHRPHEHISHRCWEARICCGKIRFKGPRLGAAESRVYSWEIQQFMGYEQKK